jgi:serine/threonine protein phosphatase PrpC
MTDLVLASPELQRLGKGSALKIYASDVGYSETIGVRNTMEDALVLISGSRWRVYVLVDGHGGSRCAHLVARYFAGAMASVKFDGFSDTTAVCARLQHLLAKKQVTDGAVFAATIIAQDQLCVAHLGGCRVLRIRRDGTVSQLTQDHKATERREMELIKKHGSFVLHGRLEGHLVVSRALGDFAIRGVIRKPDTAIFTLGKDDWRLVIACDSVCDVLDNEIVAKIVHQEPDVHRAAAIVKYITVASRSIANVSVIVIDVAPKPETAELVSE